MLSRRQPRTSSSGSRVRRRNSTTMASSASVRAFSTFVDARDATRPWKDKFDWVYLNRNRSRVVLRGRFGPMGWSAVVVRLRHLVTVFGFSP